MNMPPPLPVSPSYANGGGPSPMSILYESMDQRFGKDCTPVRLKRNTVLFSQGETLTCLYLVEQGEIALTRVSPDGRETLIAILGPGEFFGEGALLGGCPATFSARATRRSVLLKLPERKFRRALEDPQSCRMLLEAVARRCDDAWTQMEVLGCTHVRDKVRTGLAWLSGRIGVATGEGVRIDMNLSQMARMVGCARETLSREVSELRRQKAVDVRHSNGRISFFVRNPGGLIDPQ
ncbi:MAG: Crp/Fnr family transcriptional regulator [Acidobacteria bacterium]|nr:Crp/Fnr family transcriptional regulator [Acidobacteriota bacterium]